MMPSSNSKYSQLFQRITSSPLFLLLHILATILAPLVYIFETNHVVEVIIEKLSKPLILHPAVILYTLSSFIIFIRYFRSDPLKKNNSLDWRVILLNISCILLVVLSYLIVIIIDLNGGFAKLFIPILLGVTISVLLIFLNSERLSRLKYYYFRKTITDKYDIIFSDQLINLKGINFIKNQVDFLSRIQEKQDDPGRHENLMHIAYNIIHNTNHSLYKLSNIDIVKSRAPQNLNDSFKRSLEELKSLKGHDADKSFAWYVSLIPPHKWLENDWKTNYFKPFLNKIYQKDKEASNLKIDIRRIHIITRKDFSQKDKTLFEIMFIERLYGINSRVLVVQDKVEQTDADNIFKVISDIPLLDYGILYKYTNSYFSKDKQNKISLCSDIMPYYEELPSDSNRIYLLDDIYTFNELYEHFMLLWNFNQFKVTAKNRKLLNTPRLGKDSVLLTFKDLICSSNFSIIKGNLQKPDIKKMIESFFLANITIKKNWNSVIFENQIADRIESVLSNWVNKPPKTENEIHEVLKIKLESIYFKNIKITQNEF